MARAHTTRLAADFDFDGGGSRLALCFAKQPVSAGKPDGCDGCCYRAARLGAWAISSIGAPNDNHSIEQVAGCGVMGDGGLYFGGCCDNVSLALVAFSAI